MNRTEAIVALFLALLVATTAAARDSLKFVPQEGVSSSSPDLMPAVLARAIAIRVEDGRGAEHGTTIGQGPNDDDQTFPIRAASDVVEHLSLTLTRVAADWGGAWSSRTKLKGRDMFGTNDGEVTSIRCRHSPFPESLGERHHGRIHVHPGRPAA